MVNIPTKTIYFTPTKVTTPEIKGLNLKYTPTTTAFNFSKVEEQLKKMTENNNKLFKEATTATSTEKLNAKVTQSLESSLAKFGASVENVEKTLDNKISQVALPKVDLSLVKLKNNVTNATQGLGKKTTTITPTKIIEFINTAAKEVDNATTKLS